METIRLWCTNFTFFALFFPLITVAKWKWWQAALSLVGLMIIIMLIITFTPLHNSYLFVSRSFVPTALIASLSVLIASIIENIKASREKSTEKKELDPLEEQQKKNNLLCMVVIIGLPQFSPGYF